MAASLRVASLHRWLLPAMFVLLTNPSLPSQQTAAPSATAPPATAPSPQDTPVFSADVKVVNVLATVRDKHGQIINNLTKNDFKLTQDGQPQNIRYFNQETHLPLKLGLLVDTSMSQRRLIDKERTASYGFLNDLMRPDEDKAFIIHFDWEIELLQDFTASHQKLEAALDKVEMPQFQHSGGGSPGGGGGGGHHRSGGGTTLYDAIFLGSDELMRKQEGRKAIVLLTDGVDEGSKVSLDRAIETAQRSNTLVYSILYADPDAYGIPGGLRRMGRHGGPAAAIPHRRCGRPTARRSCSASRGKPADASSRYRRSIPSTRFTPRSKKSCATSTAWDTHPTRPSPATAITRSR